MFSVVLGVNLMFVLGVGMSFVIVGMMLVCGCLYMFDVCVDGYVCGEVCGVVVLCFGVDEVVLVFGVYGSVVW